jgi:hypothetical protein
MARQAEIYRVQSASFRTSGKETVAWFGQDAGSRETSTPVGNSADSRGLAQCRATVCCTLPNGLLGLLNLESLIDLVIDPPARQGGLGTAQQYLIPEPDAPVDLLVDVITREHLVLIKIAANAAPL